jgi:hypothetical protein
MANSGTNNMGPWSTQNFSLATASEVFFSNAVPNLAAAQPSFMDGNTPAIMLDTPPPTGSIVVPQTPDSSSGVAHNFTGQFNYVNSESSSRAYMAHNLNILNVGTTPPPTGSLPTFKG